MGRFDILKENTFTSSNRDSNRDNNRERDTRYNRDSNRERDNRDNNRDRDTRDSNRNSNRDSNRNSNRDSNRERDTRYNRDKYTRDNRNNSTNNLFKQKEKEKKEFFIEENKELFPDLVIKNQPDKEKNDMESQWLEIAEKEAEHDIKCNNINIDNDPKCWKGAQWIGNMLIRENKSHYNHKYNLNKDSEEKDSEEKDSEEKDSEETKCNKQIISSRIEYSRNGEKWYDNWDATFSKKQLEAMHDENNKKMIDRWSNWIERDYEKRRLESEEYYNDTGELDRFVIAENEMLEYEEYEKQFDYDDDYFDDDESLEDEIIS